MAKILYYIYQNTNEQSKAFGKWFGRVRHIETLNTRKMAAHIASHGSVYTADVVFGVLEKFRSCLIEMLLDSKKVKIDGLGTFYTTAESSGADDPEKFDVRKNIKALHIRFLPEQEQELNISSRQFIKKAEFVGVNQLLPDAGEESEGGDDSGGDDSGGAEPRP